MTDTRKQPYTLLEQQLNEMARRMALDVNSMEEFVSTGKTALLKAIDDNKDEVNTFITGKTSEINSVISGMQSDAEEVLTELQTDNSAAVAAINTAAEAQRAQIQSQVDNLVVGLTGSDYEAVFVAELNKTEEE